MNTLFVCRCFGWARDNCFTKYFHRLLHVSKLHNFIPSVFVIESKVNLCSGLLNGDAWIFRCRCSIPGVRREKEEGVGGGPSGRRTCPLLLLLAGRGKAGRDIGRWPLLVPLPVRPCLTTSARWYLWPQQPSESLFEVVVVATGGVWGGRWCL